MPRAAFLLLATARIGGDARMPPWVRVLPFGSVARDARAVWHPVQGLFLQDSGAIWRRGERHDHLGQRRPGRRGLRDVGVVEYGLSKTNIRYADPSLKPVMERHI